MQSHSQHTGESSTSASGGEPSGHQARYNPPSHSLSLVSNYWIGFCRGNNKDKLDQDFSRKILSGLSRLRSDDNFCDIELFSTEGRGRRTPVRAHRSSRVALSMALFQDKRNFHDLGGKIKEFETSSFTGKLARILALNPKN